jgi:hypothetical protein
MIAKVFVQDKGELFAQVTFTIPSSVWADQIFLMGDFNNWQDSVHCFRRTCREDWAITLALAINQVYQFRYLRDNQGWLIDRQADDYAYDGQGRLNAVLITDPAWCHVLSPYLHPPVSSVSADL